MPRKKKSNLSLNKDAKDAHKRELARLRQQKFRNNAKNNPLKYAKLCAESRKRTKKQTALENQKRQIDPDYKRVSQAIWRGKKRKIVTVDWEDFQISSSSNISANSQKRRRRRERQDLMLVMRTQKTENEALKKKVSTQHIRRENDCCTLKNPCQLSTEQPQPKPNINEVRDDKRKKKKLPISSSQHPTTSSSSSQQMVTGNFVAVAITNTKGPGASIYMAQIADLEEEGIVVKYMVKGFGGSYVWPLSPEESLEPKSNIWPITEPSKITERGHYVFNSDDMENIKLNFNGPVYFR